MPNRLPLAALVLAVVAGCDGALTPTQRLVGEWVGRPETADERLAREWPGGGAWGGENARGAEGPTAADESPPTDLEALGELRVTMRLKPLGKAELSLDGGRTRRGVWSVQPGEGRRLLVEIAVGPEGADGLDNASQRERRRFEIEMVRRVDGEPERFVLRESEADLRFGRMIFERSGE